jgi:plasmid stability protein
MAQVVVEDIDVSVLDRLQARAAAHHRSLSFEIRTILEDVCKADATPGFAEFVRISAEVRAHTATRPQTDSAILIREGRER